MARATDPVWDEVVKDMKARDQLGLKRYGERLSESTDIDGLQYLYEELLDAAVYTKRLILIKERSDERTDHSS